MTKLSTLELRRGFILPAIDIIVPGTTNRLKRLRFRLKWVLNCMEKQPSPGIYTLSRAAGAVRRRLLAGTGLRIALALHWQLRCSAAVTDSQPGLPLAASRLRFRVIAGKRRLLPSAGARPKTRDAQGILRARVIQHGRRGHNLQLVVASAALGANSESARTDSPTVTTTVTGKREA